MTDSVEHFGAEVHERHFTGPLDLVRFRDPDGKLAAEMFVDWATLSGKSAVWRYRNELARRRGIRERDILISVIRPGSKESPA